MHPTMKREEPNETFHPVTPYHDRYYRLQLSQFWKELKPQYIADPDNNRNMFHVLDGNRLHMSYARLTTSEKFQAATNRLQISKESAAQLCHIVQAGQTSSLDLIKPLPMTTI